MSDNDVPRGYRRAAEDEIDDTSSQDWFRANSNADHQWPDLPPSSSPPLDLNVGVLTQTEDNSSNLTFGVPEAPKDNPTLELDNDASMQAGSYSSSFPFAAAGAASTLGYAQYVPQSEVRGSQFPNQGHPRNLYPILDQQPSSLPHDGGRQYSQQADYQSSAFNPSTLGHAFSSYPEQPGSHAPGDFGLVSSPTRRHMTSYAHTRNASHIRARHGGPPTLKLSNSSRPKSRKPMQRVSKSSNDYEVGKPKDKEYKDFPSGDRRISKDTPLEEVARRYPNHCWNKGLRPFMAAGWSAKRLYDMLPENARQGQDAQRPHNYLQQAMRRQRLEIRKEQGLAPLPKKKRTARQEDRDDSEDLGSEYDEDASDADFPSDAVSGQYQQPSPNLDQNQRKRRRGITPLSPAPFQDAEHQQSMPQPNTGIASALVVSNLNISQNVELTPTHLLQTRCQNERTRNVNLIAQILEHDTARTGYRLPRPAHIIAGSMWTRRFQEWMAELYHFHGLDSSDISTQTYAAMLIPVWRQMRSNASLPVTVESGSKEEQEAKLWCWDKLLCGLEFLTQVWGGMLRRRLAIAAAEKVVSGPTEGPFDTAAAMPQEFRQPSHISGNFGGWTEHGQQFNVSSTYQDLTAMHDDQRAHYAQQALGLMQPAVTGVPLQHLSDSRVHASSHGEGTLMQAPAQPVMMSPEFPSIENVLTFPDHPLPDRADVFMPREDVLCHHPNSLMRNDIVWMFLGFEEAETDDMVHVLMRHNTASWGPAFDCPQDGVSDSMAQLRKRHSLAMWIHLRKEEARQARPDTVHYPNMTADAGAAFDEALNQYESELVTPFQGPDDTPTVMAAHERVSAIPGASTNLEMQERRIYASDPHQQARTKEDLINDELERLLHSVDWDQDEMAL